MKATVFSKGKNPPKNEDAVAYNEVNFVVCDGSTGKKGGLYKGRTGGEIASALIADAALQSDLNGIALVNHLTSLLHAEQVSLEKLGYEMEIETTLVCARVTGTQLIVTQVADTAFRINESRTYENPAIIDTLMSETRKRYIDLTHDIEGSREYIMPLLLDEGSYRNNADSPAGYGVLDGNPVPAKFVKLHKFNMADIQILEIYTDGYFATPQRATIEAYEDLHAKVQQEDPHKCLAYPSTKSNDDRTVMIVEFG